MKRKLAGCWLIAFALWPWAHFGLVRAYDLDPWEFAGWATLAAPIFEPIVVLFRIELRGARTMDDIQAAKIDRDEWSSDLQLAHRRYTAARADYGRLTPPPEQLGTKLLEDHGQTGMVLVVVQTRELNRTSGRMQTHLEKYVYSDKDKALNELGGGAQP